MMQAPDSEKPPPTPRSSKKKPRTPRKNSKTPRTPRGAKTPREEVPEAPKTPQNDAKTVEQEPTIAPQESPPPSYSSVVEPMFCGCVKITVAMLIVAYLQAVVILIGIILIAGIKGNIVVMLLVLLVCICCVLCAQIGVYQRSHYWLAPLMIFDCLAMVAVGYQVYLLLKLKANVVFLAFPAFQAALFAATLFLLIQSWRYLKQRHASGVAPINRERY